MEGHGWPRAALEVDVAVACTVLVVAAVAGDVLVAALGRLAPVHSAPLSPAADWAGQT